MLRLSGFEDLATNEMIQNIIEEGPKYNIVYPNKKIEKRKA